MQQASLTSGPGDSMMASRQQRQDVDVFAMSETVGSLTSEVSVLTRAVNDGTVGTITAANIAATNEVRAQNVLLTAQVSTLMSQMATVPTQLAAMSAAQAAAAATLAAQTEAALSSLETELNASVSTSLVSVTASLSESSTATAAANTQVTAAMSALTASTTLALRSKMNTKKHIFVGGCTSHLYGGWTDICMNRVETDTARPKFHKDGAARMKALVRGLFRVSGQGINESCNWARISIMVAGQNRYESLLHTSGWWWKDIHTNHVMEVVANQQFWIRQHAACGRLGYHHWSGTGGHQRNEFEYVGAARDQDI